MADDRQLNQFRRAVEEKNEKARERSGQPEPDVPEDAAPPAGTSDEQDERARSSRHGQVTADNWNQ